MKKILVCLILVMAQMSYAQKVLTAEESDPKNFNWMKGFPPAKEDILSAIDGCFFNFPALRYSVCHMREFFPTVNVASAQENRYTWTSMLVAEGTLDENKKCSDYIPELKTSAFGDATIRQVLDMTTALQYNEDYSDPNAEVWAFSAAGNPFLNLQIIMDLQIIMII